MLRSAGNELGKERERRVEEWVGVEEVVVVSDAALDHRGKMFAS